MRWDLPPGLFKSEKLHATFLRRCQLQSISWRDNEKGARVGIMSTEYSRDAMMFDTRVSLRDPLKLHVHITPLGKKRDFAINLLSK